MDKQTKGGVATLRKHGRDHYVRMRAAVKRPSGWTARKLRLAREAKRKSKAA